MKTVYAVTSGDYSDYTVHCLFEREQDAKDYIAALEETRRRVDAYPRSHDVEPFQLWDSVPVVSVKERTGFAGRVVQVVDDGISGDR